MGLQQHKGRQGCRGLSLSSHFVPPSNTSYGCCTQVLPWHHRDGSPAAAVPTTGLHCWCQGDIHKPKWFSHKNNEISNTHNQDQHRRWHTELSSSCHKMLSAAGTTHPLQRAPGWMRQLGMTSNAPRGTFAASSLGFGTSVPPSLSGCDGVEHFCLPYHGTRRCR